MKHALRLWAVTGILLILAFSGLALASPRGLITGRVTDPSGAPVAQAHIEVLRYGTGTIAETTSNADGTYSVPVGIDTGGNITVMATAPGLETSLAVVPGGASYFSVNPSMVANIRMGLAYGTASGRLSDSLTGRPVAGARVDLHLARVGLQGSVRSDPNGIFRLDEVPNYGWQTAELQVLADGYLPLNVLVLSVGQALDLKLEPAFAAIAGQVVDDSTGLPVLGAQMELHQEGLGRIDSSKTPATGNFAFSARGGGSYELRASAPGYRPIQITSIYGNPAKPAEFYGKQALRLEPEPREFGPATLLRTVSGRVTDENGAPVSGVHVTLGQPGFPAPDAYTGSDGEYRITGIPAGRGYVYVPTAEKEGYFVSSITVPGSGSWRLMSLDFGDMRANLSLRRSTGSIVGTVLDGQDKPVPQVNVRVDLATTGQSWSGTTGSDGSYRIDGLPAGTGSNLIVRGFKDGYYGISMRQVNVDMVQPVQIDPGATVTRALRATPANNTITGRVFAGTGGRPAMGATVYLLVSGYGYITSTNTDANGQYTFTNLPPQYPSRYGVRAVLFGYVSGDIQVRNGWPLGLTSLGAGQTLRLGDIRLTQIPLSDFELDTVLPGAVPMLSGPVHPPAYPAVFVNKGGGRIGTPTVVSLRSGYAYASVNGQPRLLAVAPTVMDGRTLVPLRFIGEALGATVTWDGTERRVTYALGSRTVVLWVGRTQALVNGEPEELDVAPLIQDGSTLVPVRFVSSALGAEVEYEASTRVIWVHYTP